MYLFFFQASKIVGCKLERQTDMIFELFKGACNTFSHPEEKVLLCFDIIPADRRRCHTQVLFQNYSNDLILRFDGEFYHYAGRSKYSHACTMGMANYLGKALTTGCDDQLSNQSVCSIKTELMDMNTLIWSSGPDYPFTSS